jgi:cell division protein FtsQ
VVLDRDQRILLPETLPVRALERVIALDQAQQLLDRDVIAVDLRNEHRPVLRLAPPALSALRQARGLESGASEL